jgi:lipoprotein-releasing system permease protein
VSCEVEKFLVKVRNFDVFLQLMSKIETELFIARRLSSRAAGTGNVMVRIAVATVAVSMAVMVVALAVIFGFKREVAAGLTGFTGHVEVVNRDGNSSLETAPIVRSEALEEALLGLPDTESVAPYAIKGGMIKATDAVQVVMLKGVGADYDWGFFADALTEGSLPAVGDSVRKPEILISRALADMLRLGVGERAEMLFVQQDAAPRRYLFEVSGIYNTGFEEMDRLVVPTDIRNVQRLARWDSTRITGYEVNTTDYAHLARFKNRVAELLPYGMMALGIDEKYPELFDWMRAHDVNAIVIIVIMIAVAFLNMGAALLIILLEKTRMIGLLKSLGMADGALQRVFVMRSAAIVLRGMVWGNLVGIALCLAQKWGHFLTLDQAGYFLTEVPISLGAGWLITLNAGAFVLIISLLTIPSLVVSRITPDKTIRFQ